ncbi:CAP domain-containing protein [Pseudolysinimonas sp.]|uniref:CAP domain-containing protein n=1 Tax=Pseudolysinimonas sp. TaxID=2680009 RepID=UPI00286B4D64|nr:CAP domain-containing protein [Pseudolysinimonas sp.]
MHHPTPTPEVITASPASPATTKRRTSSWLAALLLATSALLIPAASAAAAPADDIYSLVNQARAANGQNALVRNGSLDQVAAAWANQLAASGVLAHNPNYPAQIPAGWSRAGENVARGQVDANQMHSEWMASPGHRANILGDYTAVGVAFLVAGGTTWGVQVFANYPVAAAPAPPAPAPVAGSAPAAAPVEELETFSLPASDESAEEPVADPAAKVTSLSVAPFSAPRVDVTAPDWSWAFIATGVLLIAVAGIRTTTQRRYLLER